MVKRVGTCGPAAGEEKVDRIAQLSRPEAAMALGLKAMVAAIGLARENVNAFLRIALSSVARAMFDIAVERGEAVIVCLRPSLTEAAAQPGQPHKVSSARRRSALPPNA